MEFNNVEVGDESSYESAIKGGRVLEKSGVVIDQLSILHWS